MRHINDSVQLLTVGSMAYANDDRLTIEHVYPGNWTLKISQALLQDSGCYQCQINSHPPINLFILLNVQGSTCRHGNIHFVSCYVVESYSSVVNLFRFKQLARETIIKPT